MIFQCIPLRYIFIYVTAQPWRVSVASLTFNGAACDVSRRRAQHAALARAVLNSRPTSAGSHGAGRADSQVGIACYHSLGAARHVSRAGPARSTRTSSARESFFTNKCKEIFFK